MNNILYLDIETIPDQTPGALEAIRASIEPPGNISKPETIAKWMEENAVAKSEEAWRKTGARGRWWLPAGRLMILCRAV